MEVSQNKTQLVTPTNFTKNFCFFALGIGLIGGALTCTKLTFYMRLATLSYFCLVSGLFLRKEKMLHIILMSIAIFSDLIIVLLLEFQRSAIKTAISFSLTLPQQLHIGFSTLAMVFYFPIIVLGIIRSFRRGGIRVYQYHTQLGIMAFFFRTVGFLLMFSLIK